MLRGWLGRSPRGQIALEGAAARAPVKALTDCWSAGILRALAVTPLGLTELDGLIAGLTYPTLERRLAAMRRAGLLEPCPRRGRNPYTVTAWLRQAIAPLLAAARWERSWQPAATEPITRIDVEAALLLALPLLELPAGVSGSCRLAGELEGRCGRMAGVVVALAGGRVTALSSRLRGEPGASATGPARDWLRAVIEGEPRLLRLEGDRGLALAVVAGLHDALFAD